MSTDVSEQKTPKQKSITDFFLKRKRTDCLDEVGSKCQKLDEHEKYKEAKTLVALWKNLVSEGLDSFVIKDLTRVVAMYVPNEETRSRYDRVPGNDTGIVVFGQKQGVWKSVYQTCTYVNGVKHGQSVEVYPLKGRKRTTVWINGRLHGFERAWQDNRLVCQIQYESGSKHGHEMRWNIDGGLNSKLSWHHDKLHGVQRAWWPDGKMMYQKTYVHGQRHGLSETWHEDGRTYVYSEWINGKKQIR